MNTDENLAADLENTLFTFEQIEAELNYHQAQNSLRDLVNKLDLNPAEKQGLETEINGLTEMLDKLDHSSVHIAAFGMVGRGKSSVLNALIGKNVFTTGALHGVTQTKEKSSWNLQSENRVSSHVINYKLAQIELIDTPGIDEVDGEEREKLAKDVAQQADLLLFVISGDMTKVEFQALSQLREVGKPMILVFNKIDQYPEVDRIAIYETIRDRRVKELLSPDEIVMVSAAPLITQAIKKSDGKISLKRVLGQPQIDQLKLKILEILEREGLSLVALNTMLYADDVNDKILATKMRIREENANQIIWKAVITKALAIALNPVTIIDLFSGAIIDITLILALSKLYGIEMNQTSAIGLLKKIALNMGGITASELLANLGLSSLKSLLGITTTTTGGLTLAPYLSVAITQAGVAGFSCYIIGQITKVYLANGSSWGEETPKAVVTRILASVDEKSIINRIKEELSYKLVNKT
jgi:GTPase